MDLFKRKFTKYKNINKEKNAFSPAMCDNNRSNGISLVFSYASIFHVNGT